jgi:hypothetical protein
MSVTLKRLEARVEQLGATIRVEMGRGYDLQAESGAGTVFKSNGCHTLVSSVSNGSAKANEIVRRDMLEMLAYGVEMCCDLECDVCYGVECGREE